MHLKDIPDDFNLNDNQIDMLQKLIEKNIINFDNTSPRNYFYTSDLKNINDISLTDNDIDF